MDELGAAGTQRLAYKPSWRQNLHTVLDQARQCQAVRLLLVEDKTLCKANLVSSTWQSPSGCLPLWGQGLHDRVVGILVF